MTFQFLIFTITIKKRCYSKEDLERFLREQKLEELKREQELKYQMYRNWY
ncbi:YrzI family small protein [Halalkalibacterium ligniniphilum]|nr:YrzI family small protein [Halalkalibacterium ligniniphilum]